MILDHQQIELHGKRVFVKITVQTPFSMALPLIDEACFLYIHEGTFMAFAPDNKTLVHKKQSVLLKCGNYVGRMKPDPVVKVCQTIAVHFHPEVLRAIYKNDIPAYLNQQDTAVDSHLAKIGVSVLLDKYVSDILFYFENRQLVNEHILALKLKEIILLLLQSESAEEIKVVLRHLFHDDTAKFKQVIEQHIFSDLSIADLAHLTNQSMSSFKRAFQKQYSDSPVRYFQLKRLEKGKELLAYSDQSVSDIAFAIGFKSVSHFSKKFKEVYGIPPSEAKMTLP